MQEPNLVAPTDISKLVDWKNPPSLKDLKQDFQDATPAKDAQDSKIQGWLDNLNVEGDAKIKSPKGNSSIVPKLIRKQAEWRYPALSEPFLSTDDVFNVRPVTFEDRGAAEQNQLVLNHQFNNKMDKTSFIDEYVRTAVDEGTVVLRTGWNFEETEEASEELDFQYVINPEFAPVHEELAMLAQQDPERFESEIPEELKQAYAMSQEMGEAIEPKKVGVKQVKKMKVVANHPTVEVWDYRNVTIDPLCNGDIKKASFVVFSFETSLSALKKDKRYKNLDSLNISQGSGSLLSSPDHSTTDGVSNFNFSDKPRKKFVVHEYWGFWDIHGDGTVVPFVEAWVGDVVIRMEENPFPDKKLPCVIVQYLPVRKQTHGEPDGALLEDNQKILGAVTRGMIDIMGKSANGQTGISKSALDITNRRKFDKGQDYEFNPTSDPRSFFYMHTYPEIPNSAQFMLQMQNMDAESMTGVKSFSGGVSGSSLGDVAAGVRGALDAASKRELGILRRLSAGLIEVGRKFISMNSEFLSETEVVRITNETFVRVRRDDLSGSFDLKLSISTAEEDNNKAQELAFMLQTMGNNMDPSLSKMILADIAKLRKMPDLAKKIESYQPQPDPAAQEMQQLQMELLKAQLATEQAKAASLGATAQLSGSKAGTEMAKQSHLKSDTDLKNLNFVEQEAGVTQERNLQKAGEQARSQANLKEMDREYAKEDRSYDAIKEYLRPRVK